MLHEDLYLDLYDDVAPAAEYFQADSDKRNFMLETAIIAGLGFALLHFAKAFFAALGKAAGENVAARAEAAFATAEARGEREAMLQGLALLTPHLAHLSAADAAQRAVYAATIRMALVAKGFTEDVAERTAEDMFSSILDAARAAA